MLNKTIFDCIFVDGGIPFLVFGQRNYPSREQLSPRSRSPWKNRPQVQLLR